MTNTISSAFTIPSIEPGVFTRFEIFPVRFAHSNTLPQFEICTDAEAILWAIFVCDPLEKRTQIIHCNSREDAVKVSGVLKTIIDGWQIKILHRVMDANIESTYTNHRIEIAIADSDTLETDENPDDLVVITIHEANAEAEKFHQAVEIYDKLDEDIRDEIKRLHF